MSEKQVRDYDKFMLRFPDGMRDAIADRAKENGRSMNSEIIDMINNALYLPSIGQDAIDYMLELAKSDEVDDLDDESREHVEALLLQIAEKLNKKIEQSSNNLAQIIALMSRIKKPT
ncbi:Arc family DNA-binding protein [Citrobacter farmeri]|uniref:Arc family DNA-binding protein n=1 Tax=Citrobacter farmeri TaxID=67824 RepID=UPI002A81F2EC|nr:Arc family DNA-binding protein [Citrobacter farmeri]EBD9024067.1 Arc family DNA-binding protein [Salmonella enterica]